MTVRSSRMTVVLIAFAIIAGLSIVNTLASQIGISTIGLITMTFVTGKSYTDGKRESKVVRNKSEPDDIDIGA